MNFETENSVAQLCRVPDSEFDRLSDDGIASLAELARNLEVFQYFVLRLLSECIINIQLSLMVRSPWSLQSYANLRAPPESFPS
jgi:hypothetical protein